MKTFLLGCLAIVFSLHASHESRLEYLDLIKKHPSLISYPGDASRGEIEILTDMAKMAEIEAKTARDVGLIKKDKYWIWINDAVRFPSGAEGVYSRILWIKALEDPTTTGVCVMPILADGRIVLNCNFRHATRSWELELPRGCINSGETTEDAARRETLEETGKEIQELTLLGLIPPDSGVVTTLVPVYRAKVTGSQKKSPESSEAIEDILALSIPELKQALGQGYYDCKIRGEIKRIYCRDPFLTYALFLHQLKN